jgi:tetratricopeptide (TPR) repeat protein
LGLCFAAAGVVKVLSVTAFTLAWTHSIEKIEWQEDWHVTPQGLELVEARVKGSGAGMEPPPEARLVNDWFEWSPKIAPLPQVVLGNSGLAGEWRICTDGHCRTLSDVLGRKLGAEPTVMKICNGATAPKAETSGMDNAAIATEHATVRLASARADYTKGNFEAARDAASEIIQAKPDDGDAFELRGDAWVGLKNYEKALDDYDAAIRLTPKVARLYSRRAAAFGHLRNFRMAVRDYTEAVKLDHSVDRLLDRAMAFKKVRRNDLAIDDLTDAIRLAPDSAALYRARGEIYARNNAYDRAITDYNAAIRLDPVAISFLDRGMAYYLKGDKADLDRALADYDRAIALDDRMALAYNNRGLALRKKGEWGRAYADFSTALQLDPELAIAREHRRALTLKMARLGEKGQKSHTKLACAAGIKDCNRH